VAGVSTSKLSLKELLIDAVAKNGRYIRKLGHDVTRDNVLLGHWPGSKYLGQRFLQVLHIGEVT